MSTTGNAIQLVARPARSANLAFEVGGIVLEAPAVLGQTINAFDFSNFYKILGVNVEEEMVPVSGKGSIPIGPIPFPLKQNLFNSVDLDNALSRAGVLMRLRAEPIKAVLDKACVTRANMYLSKYGHISEIKSLAQTFYTGTDSKDNSLSQLGTLASSQANALAQAYGQDSLNDTGPNGVVRQSSLSTENNTSVGSSVPYLTVATNTCYKGSPYRHLFIESIAKSYRAQISLNDERFRNMLATLAINQLDEILKNELSAADQDVRRIQAAYLSTILLPPLDGTITGIYKQVGEAVAAGEPVLRIENYDQINITGSIVCNEVIAPGTNVAINTALFGTKQVTLSGTVSVMRCADVRMNNRWNLVIECPNLDNTNAHIVPLNYSFGDAETTLTFS